MAYASCSVGAIPPHGPTIHSIFPNLWSELFGVMLRTLSFINGSTLAASCDPVLLSEINLSSQTKLTVQEASDHPHKKDSQDPVHPAPVVGDCTEQHKLPWHHNNVMSSGGVTAPYCGHNHLSLKALHAAQNHATACQSASIFIKAHAMADHVKFQGTEHTPAPTNLPLAFCGWCCEVVTPPPLVQAMVND